jgi:hypothetical protein
MLPRCVDKRLGTPPGARPSPPRIYHFSCMLYKILFFNNHFAFPQSPFVEPGSYLARERLIYIASQAPASSLTLELSVLYLSASPSPVVLLGWRARCIFRLPGKVLPRVPVLPSKRQAGRPRAVRLRPVSGCSVPRRRASRCKLPVQATLSPAATPSVRTVGVSCEQRRTIV